MLPKTMLPVRILATIALLILNASPNLAAAPPAPISGMLSAYSPGYGPYLSDPAIMKELDCPDISCDGPLNFAKLLKRQFLSAQAIMPGENPLHLREARMVRETIESDLKEIGAKYRASNFQLRANFLTDPGSRVELVGIINRMDRQFLRSQKESVCGEISAIYRFSYSIRNGDQESRLPVTVNIVFPAATPDYDCRTVARRWLNAISWSRDISPKQLASDLINSSKGPLAPLLGTRINRLELNMQSYRKPASIDSSLVSNVYGTDFGTEASYLLRVFRWSDSAQLFEPVALPNQLDRSSVLCGYSDSDTLCDFKMKKRAALVAYIQQVDAVASLDNGTFDLASSLGVLSSRLLKNSGLTGCAPAELPLWPT